MAVAHILHTPLKQMPSYINISLKKVLDFNSSAFGRAGSTPATGTTTNNQ